MNSETVIYCEPAPKGRYVMRNMLGKLGCFEDGRRLGFIENVEPYSAEEKALADDWLAGNL